MADRCVFFDDLISLSNGRSRSYEVVERAGAGLTCLEIRLRLGQDWYFARRWVRTSTGLRELYRLLDRLEANGFKFQVDAHRRFSATSSRDPMAGPHDESLPTRATELHAELTPEEQRIHAELFPEEASLLAAGYDWDAVHVYKSGVALMPDALGRILETEGDVLYEWAAVPDEGTWRRFPLARLRPSLTTARTT